MVSEDFHFGIRAGGIVHQTGLSRSLSGLGGQIHIVLDNLSAHKTKAVEEFLEQNLKVRFHFPPTYSS